MKTHQYTLQPYAGMNSRYHCPNCNSKRRTFTRYIDTETGQHLSDIVGRCDRESNCGYHYTPKQYFQDNPGIGHSRAYGECRRMIPRKPLPPRPTSFIPQQLVTASLQQYGNNNFTLFINNLFRDEVTRDLIARYHIGTSRHWQGATVFWQIDMQGAVRTGKIMLYSPDTGKRVKEPYNHIHWVHALKNGTRAPLFPSYNLKQCFFGEHLLSADKSSPVAIVESEKTAIIASVYLPQFIWLASGSIEGLNTEKCRCLRGRNVVLYPDLNGYDKWNDIRKMLPGARISNLLESNATAEDKQNGLDLADYLLRFDWRGWGFSE